jgi:hypothetical protein
VPTHEPADYHACAICGRSILRGEAGVEYSTPDGTVTLVCALCEERAEGLGWVRADLAPEAPPAAAGGRRGLLNLNLRERFRRSRERPEGPAPEAHDEAEVEPEPEPEAPPEPPEPERQGPETPESRMDRALERFNAGEGPRLVAGLTRSLGTPRAAVRELQGPLRVEVTIAWELSWYRWEIGQNGHGEPRQVAKGAEVEELADDELDWNATVDGEGRLRWLDGS